MPFEHVDEVLEVRDQASANAQLSAGWSLLSVVPGFDGHQGYAVYVLGKVVSEGEQAARVLRSRLGVREKVVAVCKKAAGMLNGDPLALETLEDYRTDAEAGRLDPKRLRGFLQGLYAGGILLIEDYDELDRDLL